MRVGVTLDQIMTFIACVDEGSFSAAARRLHRAQSVVSELVSGLEAQMGFQLFDRSARHPKLTPAGISLLDDARGVVAGVDFMKARAKGISSGLEPELSAVVDVLFPIGEIADAATEFQKLFPGTPLRLFVEALGGGYQRVLDGSVSVGIVATLPTGPASISREALAGVPCVMVAARKHPLASFKGAIPKSELAKHVQLVVTDRSNLSTSVEFAVMSRSIWRLTDLFAKHAFIVNGLGWGGMPVHAVQRDLSERRLVELCIEDNSPGATVVPMSAVYLTANPPGPAGRWLIERLKHCKHVVPVNSASGAGKRPRKVLSD